MQIREYTPKDKEALFALMKEEGEEWSDYYANSDADLYYEKQGFQKVGSIFQVK